MQQTEVNLPVNQAQANRALMHQKCAVKTNWQAAWQAATGMWKNHDMLTNTLNNHRQQWNQHFYHNGT